MGTRDGVRVNAISPGFIETDRLRKRLETVAQDLGISLDEARHAQLPKSGLPRFGQPSEVGQLACFLASDKASYLQGAIVELDGGATRAI